MGNEYSTGADTHQRRASKLAHDHDAKDKAEGHFIKRVTSMIPMHKRKPSKGAMAQAAAAADAKIEETKDQVEKDAAKAKEEVKNAEDQAKHEVEKVMSDVSREGSHDDDKDKAEKKGVDTEHTSMTAIAPESLAELPPAPPVDGIVPVTAAVAVAEVVEGAVAAADGEVETAVAASALDTKPVEDLLAEAQQLQTEAGAAASAEQIPSAVDPVIASGINLLVPSPDGAAADGLPPVGSMPEEIKRELQDPVVTEAAEVTQLVTEAKESAQVAVDAFRAAETERVAPAAGESGLPPLAPAPRTLSEEAQHAMELGHERKSSTTFQTELIRARSSLKETHNSDLEMFDRVSPVLESYFHKAPYMAEHVAPEIGRQTTAEREKAALEAAAAIEQTEPMSQENASAWSAIVNPELATEPEQLQLALDTKAELREEAVVLVTETTREVDISAGVAAPVVVETAEAAEEPLPASQSEESLPTSQSDEPVAAVSPFEAFRKKEAEAQRLREEELRVKQFLETRHLSKKTSRDAQLEAAPIFVDEPAKPLDPNATPFEVFHTYEAEAQKIKHEERQVKEFLEVKRANRKLFDSQDLVPHFHL